jgi:hypothetical protein
VEEKKSKEIPLVAASETGEVHPETWRKLGPVGWEGIAYVLMDSKLTWKGLAREGDSPVENPDMLNGIIFTSSVLWK